MKKLISAFILLNVLTISPIAAQAADLSSSSSRCGLGEICRLPKLHEESQIKVYPTTGTIYNCTLWADKDDEKVGAYFRPGMGFDFPIQIIDLVDTKKALITISGKFSANEVGEIKVFGFSNHSGWVSCSPSL